MARRASALEGPNGSEARPGDASRSPTTKVMATNTQIETISTGADKAKLAGAVVLLEISPYDLDRARIARVESIPAAP